MIDLIRTSVLPTMYQLLPDRMRSPEATALLFAIGLQESRFSYRQQAGGPARGFWQFEAGGGVLGVSTHPASRAHAQAVLERLQYRNLPSEWMAHAVAVHGFITHNDVLAAAYARLLLWTDGRALPAQVLGPEAGWLAYVRNWRPGKPHRETWDGFWRQGWELTRL